MPIPLLAISMGDPAGIGPEVVLKAASVQDVRAESMLVVFGDPLILERASRETHVPMRIVPVDTCEAARAYAGSEVLPVLPISRIADAAFGPGQPTLATDRAQAEYIRSAFEAVRSRAASALVTAPINKAALARAGVPWPGHTEMLAELSGVKRPVMMLAGPKLKVVPLTTHIALADVPRRLNAPLITETLQITHAALREHFGLRKPRIAVAGLNPHAGEEGLFGDEERAIIRPAIQEARTAGIDAQGPFAADAVFRRAMGGEFDVVLGMYHDQALIPIKLLDFDSAVNVTLGLPLIRTSVDHGTAYDIAGQGVASASSMIAALRLAARMVHGKAGHS